MGTAIYSLLSVLWWNLVGQYMYYIYAKLNLSPFWTRMFLPKFDPGPPQWWRDSWWYAGCWNQNLDNRVPTAIFVMFYREAARDRYRDWVEDAADRIATPLINTVRRLMGILWHGYTTFSDWINAIRGRVGTWVPWWTSTLAAGLTLLFDWLPSDITSGLVSFYDKYLAWYEVTKSWVRATYDAAVTWASDAWDWVINTGGQLNNWWLGIRDFLDGFFHYHVPWVKSWLGDPWSFLAGAWDGLRNFYNNVWVPFKVILHDFLADPLGWMYDRVEDELIRRW